MQTRDPLHVSKILDEIRCLIDESTFEKGIREVLSDHYKVFFDADRKGNLRAIAKHKDNAENERNELKNIIGANVPEWTKTAQLDIFTDRLKELDAMEAAFNAEPMSLEAAVDAVIPRALWMTSNWAQHKSATADPR